jgi:hypothetical protein
LSDQDVVELGKLAISYEIMKAERESHLCLAMLRVPEFIKNINESWASEFLGLALSNSQQPNLPKLFANVTVIDFNYDRILPQYLYWALQHNLAIPKDAAAECVNNLRILHPYGSLGKLEWEAYKDALPFGSLKGNLAEIASRIRTYTEETQDQEQRSQIQSAIAAAKVMIVIGFGFHEQNIKIVTVTGRPGGEPTNAFMTVKGIEDKVALQWIHNKMRTALQCTFGPEMIGDPAALMFKKWRPALSLAVS